MLKNQGTVVKIEPPKVTNSTIDCPLVTVIIVNWNSGELLQRCLDDLVQQKFVSTGILVIDNGSADGSTDLISQMPGVVVQELGANLGFAKGNNHAINQIDTEFIALLNPDAFPEPDWLQKLIAAAQAFPDVAAFGSRQMVHEGDGLVDGLGDVYHFSGAVWRRGYGRMLSAVDEIPADIFSPCAAAALYRTKAFNDVGGFDEDFFCYTEDVDLGFRLRLAGYRSMFVPDSVVHHVGSATTGSQHSEFAVYHGHRNLVWTYVKNMPGWLFWACLPLHLAMNIAAICWFVLRGQGVVILKAKRDAIKGVPRMWRKRRCIQRRRKVSISDIWKVLDKRLWITKE